MNERTSRERSRKARGSKPSKKAKLIAKRALSKGLCDRCSSEKRKPRLTEIFALWNDQCRACGGPRGPGRSTLIDDRDRRARRAGRTP